jgi:hypothetical protein
MRRIARRSLLAALALSLVSASSASAAVTQLGPRPNEGGAGLISGTVSPSVVRADEVQTVTMNTEWSTFYSPNAEFGPVIFRTSTMSPGSGTVQTPFCITVLFFAGSTSCAYKRTAATGSWATAGFTITLNNGNSATYTVPYAVLPPNTYNIGGKLIARSKTATGAPKEEPVAGIDMIVEQVGGSEKYTATTGGQGQYDVQVGPGTWRVRSTDRSFCHDLGGGSVGGCSRAPTTTTGGDKTVNFVQPGPIDVTGTVKTADGTPVREAKVRATQVDTDGEEYRTEAISGADGKYRMEGLLPNVKITFDSPVPYICPVETSGAEPKIGDDSTCKVPKVAVLPAETDITQDFVKPGCTAKIDFGSSMAATSRCFKLTAPETWETDEQFRLNGIDFHPSTGQKVTFDKTARTVDFGLAELPMSLQFGKVSQPLPPGIGLGTVRFEAATVKFSYNEAFGIPANSRFGGYPMSEQVGIEMTTGKSAITLKLVVPVDPAKQFDFIGNNFGKGVKTLALGVKLTSDNDFGASGIKGSLENPGNLAGLGDPKFTNPIGALKEVSVGYDFPKQWWTFGGKFEPKFLKGAADASDEDARGGEIEASVSGTGLPTGGSFKELSFSASKLNRPLSRGYYLQRLQGTIPMDLWQSNAPMSFKVGGGVSVGPAQQTAQTITIPSTGLTPAITFPKVPAEKLSWDGDITVAWSRMADEVSNDLSITGTVGAKFWDQDIGKASLVLYPYSQLGALRFDNIGFTDPTGGSLFAVRGQTDLWLDAREESIKFYAGARGAITFGGEGVTGEWIIAGPYPMVAGVCTEQFGERLGLTVNFDDPLASTADAQCDLGPFRKLKPVPPPSIKAAFPPPFSSGADQNTGAASRARRSSVQRAPVRVARAAKAAKSQTFKVRGNEGVVPLEVSTNASTPGFPDVLISGPGLSIRVKDGKAGRTKNAVGFVFPARRMARFMLNRPRAGTYRITVTEKGAAPLLEAPRFAAVLPEVQVETGLDRSQCAPTVHWNAGGLSGQSLRFVERTAQGLESQLGTTTKSSGSLKVTPLAGAGRAELFVEVLNGVTVRGRQSIGTYSSAVGDALPGPSRVKVAKAATKKRQGKTTKQSTVSWQPVCGAEAYSVVVTQGKSESKPVTVSGASASVPRPKAGATVTVTSLGRGGVPGGSTLVPVG